MFKKLKVQIARDGDRNGKNDGKLNIHIDDQKPAYADTSFFSLNPTGFPDLYLSIKNGEYF